MRLKQSSNWGLLCRETDLATEISASQAREKHSREAGKEGEEIGLNVFYEATNEYAYRRMGGVYAPVFLYTYSSYSRSLVLGLTAVASTVRKSHVP